MLLRASSFARRSFRVGRFRQVGAVSVRRPRKLVVRLCGDQRLQAAMSTKGGAGGTAASTTAETDSKKVPIVPEAELFRSLAEGISTVKAGWVVRDDHATDGTVHIMVVRQTADVSGNKSRSYAMSYTNRPGSDAFELSSPFPTPLGDTSFIGPSPSGRKMAMLRTEKGKGEGGKDKQYLELWDRGSLVKSVCTAGAHDSLLADGWFSGFSWSADESCVAYVASPTPPKAADFWDKEADPERRGTKFYWREDWGEKYVGVVEPRIYVLFWDSGRIKPVQGIPDDVSAGQAALSPDGRSVVFTGWKHSPRKLGMIYCFQRPCTLYIGATPADSDDDAAADAATCEVLTTRDTQARSPRFSHDGSTVAYLACNGIKTHGGPSALCVVDMATRTSRVLVDIVDNPESEEAFPGIFATSLPARCWTKDGSAITLTTQWKSQMVVISVAIETGSVSVVPPPPVAAAGIPHGGNESRGIGRDASYRVLDVHDTGCLLVASSPIAPESIWMNDKTARQQEPRDPVLAKQLAGIRWNVDTVAPSDGSPHHFHTMTILPPPSDGGALPPLVVFPHGGPHSVYGTDFFIPLVFMALQGMAVTVVNYRGSTGFGRDALNSLPGNCGTNDVADVRAATEFVLAQDPPVADPSRVGVTGGSHGGFLGTHMIGQHPDVYKAAAVRNPVTNIASMCGVTDIPDWCGVEAGVDFDFAAPKPFRAADLARMFSVSPIAHVHRVKAPLLLLIGKEDRRVPPSQGLDYYHALKSAGGKVQMIWYPEDCHALDSVGTTADAWVHIAQWMQEHL